VTVQDVDQVFLHHFSAMHQKKNYFGIDYLRSHFYRSLRHIVSNQTLRHRDQIAHLHPGELRLKYKIIQPKRFQSSR